MILAQPRICPRQWDAQTPQGFCNTNGSPNLGQTARPLYNQQKDKELAELWTLLSQLITE